MERRKKIKESVLRPSIASKATKNSYCSNNTIRCNNKTMMHTEVEEEGPD